MPSLPQGLWTSVRVPRLPVPPLLAARCLGHGQLRPYVANRDLLKRHLAAHESPSGTTKSSLGRTLRDVPSRVLQACAPCAANHIRCSEQKPCRRCTEKDITCVWNSLEGTATPATAESSAPFQLGSLEQIQQKTSTTGADLSEDTSDGPVPRPLDNHGSGGHLGVEPSSPESALGMRLCHPHAGNRCSDYFV